MTHTIAYKDEVYPPSWIKQLARAKLFRLFCRSVNDEQYWFCNIDTCGLYYKHILIIMCDACTKYALYNWLRW